MVFQFIPFLMKAATVLHTAGQAANGIRNITGANQGYGGGFLPEMGNMMGMMGQQMMQKKPPTPRPMMPTQPAFHNGSMLQFDPLGLTKMGGMFGGQ